MKQRKISSAIAAILAAAAFVSCGEVPGVDTPTTTDIPQSTSDSVETELVPDLPAYDGKGREFTILGKMEGDMSGRWTALDLYVDEQNGDTVNDAVYDRNLAISTKYNIELKAVYKTIGQQYSYSMYNEISKLMMAGENEYDFIMPTIQDAALLARDGLLYDLNEIGNVDLSKPWWSQQFNEDVNIGGRSYYGDGDICMAFIRASYCVLFNKDIVRDYGITDPYEMVNNGTWTIDNMLVEAAKFASDTNGDGSFTAADNVGIGILNNHAEVFYSASGSKFVTYDPKNEEFTFTGGSERSLGVLEKILKLYTAEGNVICFTDKAKWSPELTGDHVNAAAQTFEAGRLLFLAGTMNNVPTMRGMETDFGILPYPKYDEAQDKYYTYVQTWAAGCAAIPINVKDVEASSIIMEDMAYHSKKYVTPAFYDKALKGKYVRDNESIGMLDLICENRTCDIGNLFNIGQLISGITAAMNSGSGNFASLIASKQSAIDTTLTEITALYSSKG